MSQTHVSAFGWPFWGAVLLIVPTAFVVGALTGHTPSWGLVQNPIVLLSLLAVAAFGNLWSLVHTEVIEGNPPILRVDIAANVLSIVVLVIAALIGVLLLGYGFVENFTRR